MQCRVTQPVSIAMAGMRDFLSKAFEAVGHSLLNNGPPPPSTPLAAMPMQMQEDRNQPPHAQGPEPPEDNPDPWLLLTGTTPDDTPLPTVAMPAAINQQPPPLPPPPPMPPCLMPPDTLPVAVLHMTTWRGLTDVSHKHKRAWQDDVGGASARTKVFKEQALAGPLWLFAFMQPGN